MYRGSLNWIKSGLSRKTISYLTTGFWYPSNCLALCLWVRWSWKLFPPSFCLCLYLWYCFYVTVCCLNWWYDYSFQMLSFMHAHSTFFHQGHDLFKEFEPEMKNVATLVCILNISFFLRHFFSANLSIKLCTTFFTKSK